MTKRREKSKRGLMHVSENGPMVMNRREVLALSASLAIGSFAVTGRAQAAECAEDTLDRIARTGTFNLGAREATPPYGFKDAAGNYVGFSTDMAHVIHANVQKELGKKIKLNYIPVTSKTRIPLLQNSTIDMEAGATVITQPRVKVVDFGVPNFLTSTLVMVRADSPIRSLADLGGKRIGVPQGGLEEKLYRGLGRDQGLASPVTPVGFPDHPQGFTALETGSVDAYSSDGPILFGMKNKAGDPNKWRIFDPGLNVFLQAFPLRPQSSKFRRIVDLTIVGMYADGEWDRLFDKYFGPKGVAPFEKTDSLRTLGIMYAWPT
jgi:glutamate/aspartate transport system substrate-binding protein